MTSRATATEKDRSQSLSQERRQDRRRTRAILAAGLAHMVPPMGALPLVLLGSIPVSTAEWLLAFTAPIVLWCPRLWIARSGWHRRLTFDRHFLVVPAFASMPLFWLNISLMPELRASLIQGWFGILLVGAGFLGFRQVMALNSVMISGYFALLAQLPARFPSLDWGFEIGAVAPFIALCTFGALVLERLRRDRLEMKALRHELSHLALTDRLTGLANRRQLEEAMERQAHRLGLRPRPHRHRPLQGDQRPVRPRRR